MTLLYATTMNSKLFFSLVKLLYIQKILIYSCKICSLAAICILSYKYSLIETLKENINFNHKVSKYFENALHFPFFCLFFIILELNVEIQFI